MKNDISLMLTWEPADREKQLELALEHGYGLEVAGLAWPPLFNDENLLSKWCTETKALLAGFPNMLSLHGPFTDVIPHSPDAVVRRNAKDKIRRSIDIALGLGARRMVFHPGINPLNLDPNYIDELVKVQGLFWKELLDTYPAMTICLENIFDFFPSTLLRIWNECPSERLGFCFDAGHFNVFAKCSLAKWFATMGDSTIHFHLHDNRGDGDNHLPIGDGTFDWPAFLAVIKTFRQQCRFVIEVPSYDGQVRSLAKLDELLLS